MSTCTIEGCDAIRHRKQPYCNKHYRRKLKYGDPVYPMQKRADGEGYIDQEGYVIFSINGKSKRGHIIVMEKYLGRPLLPFPQETVHHKNGNRSDNRIENLELWSTKQPKGQRIEDKLLYANEIIALYGDLEDEYHGM
jgi:hypothetical protein